MGANIMYVIGVLILMLVCFLAGFCRCAKLVNESVETWDRGGFIRKLFGWCPHCGRWFRDDVRDRGRGIKMCRECAFNSEMRWAALRDKLNATGRAASAGFEKTPES